MQRPLIWPLRIFAKLAIWPPYIFLLHHFISFLSYSDKPTIIRTQQGDTTCFTNPRSYRPYQTILPLEISWSEHQWLVLMEIQAFSDYANALYLFVSAGSIRCLSHFQIAPMLWMIFSHSGSEPSYPKVKSKDVVCPMSSKWPMHWWPAWNSLLHCMRRTLPNSQWRLDVHRVL